MPLSRIDKEFSLPLITQVEAKHVRVDRALSNLLLLIKTDGRPVKTGRKSTILIEHLAQELAVDQNSFHGFDGERVALLARWIESDFADVVRTGRGGHSGQAVLAGLKPLHLDVVKLRHPTHAKDGGVSRFLYSVVRQDPNLVEVLKEFFGVGSRNDHYDGSNLDLDTLFLLLLLDRYEFDRHNLQKDEYHEPVCAGATAIMLDDLRRIMLYARHIPRREIIRSLLTLISFHLALSMLKTYRLVNGIVRTGRGCKGFCRYSPQSTNPLPDCPYRLDIFVDISEKKDLCDVLAQTRVKKHYAELAQYIKNHIRLKKLDEFRTWLIDRGYESENRLPRTIMGLLAIESHAKVDVFFEGRIENLLSPSFDEEVDQRLVHITRLGMDALDTYVEALFALRHNERHVQHRKLLDALCGKNLETGFLRAGKGRAGRRYYLGTELLDTLVQVAVVGYDTRRGFYTRGITIPDFVAWLKERYGILIDEYGEPAESVELTEALRNNYQALKVSLRQLGFYTDLSDASNSQLIQPRFQVH